MKLASLRDGTRGGRLVVVSRDLTQASDARHIAPTLQAALDDWEHVAPQLELIARSLESGGQPVERFHERDAHAPMPNPAEGAAYLDPRSPIALAGQEMALAPGVTRLAGGATPLLFLASAGDGAPLRTFAPAAVTPDELAPDAALRVTVNGKPAGGAPVLHLGDTVRIEVCDPAGHSVFGAIEQTVAPAAP